MWLLPRREGDAREEGSGGSSVVCMRVCVRVLYIGLADVPGRRVMLAGYVRGACKGDAKNAKVLDTPTAGGRTW